MSILSTNSYRPLIFTNYDLPFDLLELIFSFLSFGNNLQCLLVSKHWFHFVMDQPHFSKLCSNELPSMANNRDVTMKLLQQIVSSQSHFIIQGSSSTVKTETDQNNSTATKKANDITPSDTVRLLGYILKNNNTQIDSVCRLFFFLFLIMLILPIQIYLL